MPEYHIHECRPTGFHARGDARKLWGCRDREVILSGPAETGKTFCCLQKLDALLWHFPGSQAAMLRKTYSSLTTSAMRTYTLKVLGQGSPVTAYGGDKPEWFDYPNGSRLYVGGMDTAEKVLSSDRDFIYVNQAEELDLHDWETLTTRVTGRAGNAPFAQLFGDCNPGPPSHWIKHRPSLTLLESRHEDNPLLWDGTNWTPQGLATIAVLDALTGVRKERLRHGRWRQAEGAVYPEWDSHVHLIDRFEIPSGWPRLWSIDFGYVNPFVWQAWALDDDGRLYRYREIYMTGRLVEDHARQILQVTAGEPRPAAIVCDHDAEGRATLERHLGQETSAAIKAVLAGIEAVAARLRRQGDGRPRVYFLRDSLVERDQALAEAKKPTCTEEEFEGYTWQTRGKEAPVKENDHGMDDTRYLVASLDLA